MTAETQDHDSLSGLGSAGVPEPGERQDAANGSGLEAAGVTCHRCGESVPLGTKVCPHCEHGLYRQCFCGQAFPANLAQCPACGTDWAKSVRIRRRSRSDKVRPRLVARSAVLGALIAVLAAGMLNVVISAMARRATPDGAVPAHLGERLYYAWHTLSTAMGALLGILVGGLGYTLLIALLGAVVGALVCLLPALTARGSRALRHRSHRTRRRRSEH